MKTKLDLKIIVELKSSSLKDYRGHEDYRRLTLLKITVVLKTLKDLKLNIGFKEYNWLEDVMRLENHRRI